MEVNETQVWHALVVNGFRETGWGLELVGGALSKGPRITWTWFTVPRTVTGVTSQSLITGTIIRKKFEIV